MREALNIKESFADNGENWHLYLSRMDKLRDERTTQNQLEHARQEELRARLEEKRARDAEQQALRENERISSENARISSENDRLRRLLGDAGIDPD